MYIKWFFESQRDALNTYGQTGETNPGKRVFCVTDLKRPFKAGLHYATRLQATRRLRKVKAERCCLQRGCMQNLWHVYTMQHGCSDDTLICLQATVWRHSYIARVAKHRGWDLGIIFLDLSKNHFYPVI